MRASQLTVVAFYLFYTPFPVNSGRGLGVCYSEQWCIQSWGSGVITLTIDGTDFWYAQVRQ